VIIAGKRVICAEGLRLNATARGEGQRNEACFKHDVALKLDRFSLR
jgi:hypothetical protein